MQPKLDTAEKIRSALRQAGIEFSDYEPEQGFTMIVRGKALKEQLDQINEQERAITKRVVERFSGLIQKG
jgi:hypothetical protein